MADPTWHVLGPVSRFSDGAIEGRLVAGARLCVGQSGGTHFAIDDTCPHAGGSLSEGLLDGDLVICPLHAYGFEILTGECIDDAHCSVSAYPVRVEDGIVQVRVSGTSRDAHRLVERSAMSDQQSDLYFRQLAVGQMANFAYLVGSRSTREALIIDPAWDVDQLLDVAEQDGMEIVGALVTHYHQDHIGGELFGHRIPGLDQLLARKPVPIHVHEAEAEGTLRVTGISRGDLETHTAGDVLELGAIRTRLLHTPGHTPGSQCFLVEETGRPGQLVSGDTLFLGSCGRVDLPGSDPEAMYRSLTGTLKKLPDETLLFPGHLYSAEAQGTLGDEKRSNPFLRVSSLEMFLNFMGA